MENLYNIKVEGKEGTFLKKLSDGAFVEVQGTDFAAEAPLLDIAKIIDASQRKDLVAVPSKLNLVSDESYIKISFHKTATGIGSKMELHNVSMRMKLCALMDLQRDVVGEHFNI